MRAPGHLPLYWKICLINGAVFLVGTLVLVLSPAERLLAGCWSPRRSCSLVGLAVMLLTNALLLRAQPGARWTG